MKQPRVVPSPQQWEAAFQRLFPDCDITYVEDWIETSPGTKELKKGVRVDWS